MREVVISDVHWPFEDRRAWPLTLRVVKKIDPDLICILGDWVDFYAISRWDRNPRRRLQLQFELDMAVSGLCGLRSVAPHARMVFQEGNHEHRLRRYLWQKASELSGLSALQVENLLKLAEFGVEFVEYGIPQKIGELWHIHGSEGGGGQVNVARGKLLKFQENVIFGHHHRHQVDFQRSLSGKTRGAWANGCLCGLKPEYDIAPDWTQGVTLVEYAKSGVFHASPIIYFEDEGKLRTVIAGELL